MGTAVRRIDVVSYLVSVGRGIRDTCLWLKQAELSAHDLKGSWRHDVAVVTARIAEVRNVEFKDERFQAK